MALAIPERVERPVPYDLAAEEAVLGSLLLERDAIIKIAPFLRADDFYREAHGWIYAAVLDLYARREPPDTVTLASELERTGRLDPLGGYSYLISLVNRTPTAVHIEYYAHIVERASVLRRLISAGGEIAALGYSEEHDVANVLDKAEQLLFNVSQRTSTKEFASIEQVLNEYYDRIESIQHNPGTVVGVPTGFHDLDEVTGGLQRSDLIIVAARPGIGKCLPGHTLIDDPITGARLTLHEYFQRKLQIIIGVSNTGHVRPTEISYWIDSGVKPTYRVRTRLGREVEVTGHHPFLTVNGWVPLHDLSVGDAIAVPRALPVFGSDASISMERVRILGYLIAEGCLTHSTPGFTNADPEIVQDLKACITQEFPECEMRLQVGSDIDYRISRPYAKYPRRGTPNPLTVWLRELGLWGKLASDKAFPSCVWQWDAPRLAELLRVLMSCDGSIYPDNRGNPRIEFTVASQQLAADVYHAFVRFGIVARLYKKKEKCWRVQVTEGASIRRYNTIIGWIGEKSRRFAHLPIQTLAQSNGNVGHPPQITWALVTAARQAAGLSMIELARRAGETTATGKYAGYNAHMQRTIPRSRLAGYGEVLNSNNLRLIASADLFWDTIASIEYAGEQRVYDLTVPDGSNFIAQDVCVHNTSLVLGIAHNAAMPPRNKRVGVFSLEMSREQLVQRLLAVETGVDSQSLRLGYLNDDEWHLVSDAIGRLAQMPIYIDDSAGLNIHEVRSKARRLEAEVGVDLIIIDYLQLMQGSARKDGNRVQEVSEISRNLKMLAREINVPIIACAQLSRAVESRTSHVPILSDLRESGCLAGETPIYLPDEGVYRPIEQLVGHFGFRVLALNTDTWQLEPRPVLKAFATGTKPVYKLSTRLGRTIRATANHKFLTLHGWQRLDALTPATRIALPRQLPGPAEPSMPDAELALLGHLIGDGCTLARSPIHYTTNDLSLAETVASLATEVFGDAVKPRIQRERDWYQVYLPASYHLTHGVLNPVAAWLDGMGIFNLRSHEKRVPERVFAQPTAAIATFLRHLWSTDGCIHMGSAKHTQPTIYYASSSQELARNVQSLLLRLSINATLHRIGQSGKGRDQYHVVVDGKRDIERFLYDVGALGTSKTEHRLAILDYLITRVANTNRDVLPREVWRLMAVPAMQTAGMTSRQMQAALGNAYCGTALYKQNVSRERATRLAHAVQSDSLARLAQSDVYWDEITSIEPDGEAEVYDLTVDELHNFVAADILAHNSIEQDADIVMFIHREEMYNQESEKKGIAEIHISKHRNGPLATIPLRFFSQTTKFTDLEVYRQEP